LALQVSPHFPFSAQDAHKIGLETDKNNFLLMLCFGDNVPGLNASVIAGGLI
jgi:Na+-transporting methylmalonyl-CoA/oxaloacetate decarboxylase beta subunit